MAMLIGGSGVRIQPCGGKIMKQKGRRERKKWIKYNKNGSLHLSKTPEKTLHKLAMWRLQILYIIGHVQTELGKKVCTMDRVKIIALVALTIFDLKMSIKPERWLYWLGTLRRWTISKSVRTPGPWHSPVYIRLHFCWICTNTGIWLSAEEQKRSMYWYEVMCHLVFWIPLRCCHRLS